MLWTTTLFPIAFKYANRIEILPLNSSLPFTHSLSAILFLDCIIKDILFHIQKCFLHCVLYPPLRRFALLPSGECKNLHSTHLGKWSRKLLWCKVTFRDVIMLPLPPLSLYLFFFFSEPSLSIVFYLFTSVLFSLFLSIYPFLWSSFCYYYLGHTEQVTSFIPVKSVGN